MELARFLRVGKDCVAVFKWAFVLRFFMLAVQVLSNLLVPDHRGSMDDVTMRFHRHPDHDFVTETLLGGFDNWDSEYYIYIAQHGYTFLQSMAFFPLYPMIMSIVGRIFLFPFSFILADRSIFLLAGTLVNICIFPLATVALYLLTHFVSGSQKISTITILLFCLNPASVFMSAVYTETLYAFCTFTGLCLVTKHCLWSASVFFSLATATRSNGIVLAGFIVYYHLNTLYRSAYIMKTISLKSITKVVVNCTVQGIIVALPFIIFQCYSYWKFCQVPATSGVVYEWCHWTLPLSYSYIQEHYWDVGFLRYFELKQVPNFVLALPVVCMSICTIYYYGCGGQKLRNDKKKYGYGYLPYILHLLFLLVFGVFNMHIQVLTRFLFSSSPLLYWFAAEVMCDSLYLSPSTPPSSYSLLPLLRLLALQLTYKTTRSLYRSQFIIIYFMLYIVLGFILHCNFYPWT